jgi:hypothetical protein
MTLKQRLSSAALDVLWFLTKRTLMSLCSSPALSSLCVVHLCLT